MIGRKTKFGVAAVAAAGLAVAGAAPTIAQATNEALVNQLLGTAAGMAKERGFSSTHSRHNGSLNVNQTETVTLDLNAGTSYMVIGLCDQDCSDIDLWISDENGYEIDSDTLEDDVPIVEVTPRRNARFSIRAKMITCNVEPCFYGIGVYGK